MSSKATVRTHVSNILGKLHLGGASLECLAPAPLCRSYKVSYVETTQLTGWRSKGALTASFTVSPGEAVILHMQGGRSSPDSLMAVPPVLESK